jgi:UDP-N-acetylglucosamine 2-epimerase (non-hydrolysing)
MKKISMIIGARPNFMKAFPVYEALKEDFDLTLIHTGQHFDSKMSDVFLNQLKFPRPDIHLTLEKKTKSGDFDDKLYVNNKEYLKNKDTVIEELMNYDQDLGQLGEIRDKLKIEFEKIKPDLVIVFGDVTSTLAAGLSAKTLNIDLAHVESGLRSGDMLMPEEVNRVLTDHITKYYFVTEQSGIDNFKEIGITENVYLVGNTMIDTQKKYLQQALDTQYYETLRVKPKEYILITLHRPSNVDNMDKLKEIFDDFEELSKKETLVYPIHPRTKINLEKIGYLKKVEENPNIILDEPLGYLEFTCLLANCKYLITDSGGLQEESTALDIPCFTLRENTERPITLIENKGTNQMIHKISEIELIPCKGTMDLWDGKSSVRISNIISKNINIYLDSKLYMINKYKTKEKTAILLRGYHYDKNHSTQSSFKRRFGLYDLDYERHFKETFNNVILNDKRFDYDIFIVTNDSIKLSKLLDDFKPKDHSIIDFKKKEQKDTFITGLELIKDYSKKNNIIYKDIAVYRMDQKINKNPMDFINVNIQNLVTVFLLDLHILYKNFSDYFHYIPFNILNQYLELCKNNESFNQNLVCHKSDVYYPNKLPNIGIYHYIKLSKSDSNMLETDREHECSAYTDYMPNWPSYGCDGKNKIQ